MTLPKSRCKKCFSANKKIIQEPCNKCSEIQFLRQKFDNYFLEADKNLMREVINREQ